MIRRTYRRCREEGMGRVEAVGETIVALIVAAVGIAIMCSTSSGE